MGRQLHKKKDKELYALYSTIVDDYVTEFLSKEEIKKIWLNDFIKDVKEKVDKYMEQVDKEVE